MRTVLMALTLCLCSPSSALAQEWVKAGWQQISARHDNKALIIWQQGIDKLDDKRLLASIGVYAHFPYAIAQLKQVGPVFDAFIARRQQHGKVLYFVLSASNVPKNHIKRQNKLAGLKQAAGITGLLLATEARNFKYFKSSHTSTSLSEASIINSKAKTVRSAGGGVKPTIHFSINRFEISGNSQVSNDVILIGLRDFYGSAKRRSDLRSIRTRILEIYRMSGIHHVQVSKPQLVDNDTVQITIQEKH
ncbi:MAG: hypothetical protein Q9M82_06310 [Mariprofundus sp.]|nr:hypothetical protein [Mariprofundus sp.]